MESAPQSTISSFVLEKICKFTYTNRGKRTVIIQEGTGLVKSQIAGGYFVKTKNAIVSVMSMIAAKAE